MGMKAEKISFTVSSLDVLRRTKPRFHRPTRTHGGPKAAGRRRRAKIDESNDW